MKILNKYVLEEHVGPLLFALSALTSLLLLNYVAKQFGQLVGKGLGWQVIGEFFLLSIPFTIAMTLPMAVLVSVLYAFSRLASENEITALKASGVGMTRVMVPVLLGATGIALAMIAFNDQVLPRANHRLRVLQGDIARKKPTFALREQVINEVSPGKLSLRAGHLDEGTSQMREVTIWDLGDPSRRRTIYADSGTLLMAATRTDLELVLHDGYIQELPRSEPGQLQRIYFHTNTIRIRDVFNSLDRSTEDNFKSDREMSICEMQDEVAGAESDARLARAELAALLTAYARRATTGLEPQRDTTRARGGASWSLATLYCRAMDGMGVKSANAAEPPAVQEPATQQPAPPSAARRPAPSPSAGRAAARNARDSAVSQALRMRALDEARATGRAPSAGSGDLESRGRVATPASLSLAIATIEASRTRLEDDLRTANTYAVEIQKKFALAIACVVFVLLGAPIALRFPRGGVGLTIGVSLAVFALYYVGLIGGEELADRGILSPFWAMWATNVLFTIVGLFLLSRMGKEGATARGGDMGEAIEQLKAKFKRRKDRRGTPALAGGAD